MKRIASVLGMGFEASPDIEVIRAADGRYLLSVRDTAGGFVNSEINENDLKRFALDILIATGAVGGPFGTAPCPGHDPTFSHSRSVSWNGEPDFDTGPAHVPVPAP